MKNIKLKQTKLCTLILLSPFIAAVALFICSKNISERVSEESALQKLPLVVTAIIIVSAVLFVKKLGTSWLVMFGAVMNVSGWKKDRRFYFTDVNGRTAEEVVNAIKLRMNHYAKELNAENKSENAVGTYKKRRHFTVGRSSGYEDYYVLYKTEILTKDFCGNALSECKRIMQNFAEKNYSAFLPSKRERKHSVIKACALVIICDGLAGFNAEEYVRKNFSQKNTGLAVCIYESSTGRYFLNGVNSAGLFADSVEEIAFNLIKKSVFCKKLGLKENSYYMPTDELIYNPEMTFFDALKDAQKEIKSAESENEKIVERLDDGEVYYDGEKIFYKKNGQTLIFSVANDGECEGEEPNNKIYVLTTKSWSYPKSSKISNKDYIQAIEKISEYLNLQGVDFEFKEFGNWFEENYVK